MIPASAAIAPAAGMAGGRDDGSDRAIGRIPRLLKTTFEIGCSNRHPFSRGKGNGSGA